VLASEVQVESPTDTDRLRFGLTGEAGLNDGTAFPFLMLGLGLLGVHPLGTAGWRWLSIDLLWASGAGLVTGWLLGTAIGRLVVHLRRTHREAVGLDDFLALGLIALAHGVAVALAGYGFLAVFAAGLALRRIEARESGDRPPHEVLAQATAAAESRDLATCGEAAPAYMAQAVLGFTEQLERVAEVALMIVLGMMLASTGFAVQGFALSALLFLGIRPLVTWLCSAGTGASHAQRLLIGWFGIRGIGSLYYLLFAITHGLPAQLAEVMVAPVLTVLATSAVVHGISVTPLMSLYSRRRRRHGELAGAVAPSGDVDATLR
jgi:NhaP-type Na+/H+ or K+/H+ antiporter